MPLDSDLMHMFTCISADILMRDWEKGLWEMHILNIICFISCSFHGVWWKERDRDTNKQQNTSVWSVAIISLDQCSYRVSVKDQDISRLSEVYLCNQNASVAVQKNGTKILYWNIYCFMLWSINFLIKMTNIWWCSILFCETLPSSRT